MQWNCLNSGDCAGDWCAKGVPNSIMLAKPFAPRSLSPLFPNFSMLLRHQHKSAAAHTIAEEETAFTRTLQGVSER